ncbi:hypothetical protein MBLNU459_g7231t1 [Dothideomycetes sp. NU459]
MGVPTIAFLGATGGCAGYCLAAALENGNFNCRALVRKPEKLHKSLHAKGISEQVSNSHLTMIKGNAKDVNALKQLLVADGDVVDVVVFAVGAALKFQASIMPVTIDDKTVCETSMVTLLSALSELKPSKKPLVIAVSTTGISSGPNDVPRLLIPLYHWLLAIPHQDKRGMERLLKAQKGMDAEKRVTGGFVIARASLLTDGLGKGILSVRQGTEEKPAIGYTIARKDVGTWIFEKLIGGTPSKDVIDEAITLTC